MKLVIDDLRVSALAKPPGIVELMHLQAGPTQLVLQGKSLISHNTRNNADIINNSPGALSLRLVDA